MKSAHDPSIDFEDLVQEAYIGLWNACTKFDETKGFEFSTYAVPYIRGTILRFLRDTESISTPRAFHDIRTDIARHGFSLPLTDEDVDILVSEGRFSRSQILNCVEFSLASLEDPIPGKDNIYIGDRVVAPSSEIQLSEDELEAAMDDLLLCIKPKNRDLVEEWLYASMEGEKINQQSLADKYNISQAQVSRVINSAVRSANLHREEILSLLGLG